MPQRDPGVYPEDIECYAEAAIRDRNRVYDIAVRHAPELSTAVREALKEFPQPTR